MLCRRSIASACSGCSAHVARWARADPARSSIVAHRVYDAGVPHDPQRRQRLLADLGDRGPRARPATGHRHAGHRPVGRRDGRALRSRRRPRVRSDRPRACSSSSRSSGQESPSERSTGSSSSTDGSPTRSSSRWRRSASCAASRSGPRTGRLSSACRQSVQTIGGGTIDWLPYSIIVVAVLAARLPRLDDADGLGALALRRGRQPGRGQAVERSRKARPRHGLRPERTGRGVGGLITAGLINGGCRRPASSPSSTRSPR